MNPHTRFSHRQRPPWWPENEEWPPRRWGHRPRNAFFRRMGCMFVLLNLFAILLFGSFVGMIITALDRGGYPGNPFNWLLPIAIVFVVFALGLAFIAARNI